MNDVSPIDLLLSSVPPREEIVYRLHIGCHDAAPLTFGEIAQLLGLSRQQCLRLYRNACKAVQPKKTRPRRRRVKTS